MQGTRVGNVFGVWEVKQVTAMGGGGVGNEAKEGERRIRSCGALRALAFVQRGGKHLGLKREVR